MHIVSLKNLSADLFSKFTDESSGKSVFSILRSSQTGNERYVDPARLAYLQQSLEHIMLLAIEDDILVGMVVGQRVVGIGNEYFYINDIVVSPDARSGGIGTQLMDTIVEECRAVWPAVARIQLTSRTSRGTGPFFMKLGFKPRTKETGDETIVYVKDFDGYTS